MNKKIRIGSRGSKLAVTQAKWIGAELKKVNSDLDISFVKIQTTGDKDTHSSLSKIGGKGIFVKEIEEALSKKEIDLAVHSLKDLPQMLPSGLVLGPYPKREDNRDAFVSRFGEHLKELPKGSTIGTGSPRRSAQIEHRYKGRYRIAPIRGNVDTRMKKVEEGMVDAVVLATAGLKRLGRENDITQIIEPDEMLPAPGQGCLGLELREEDQDLFSLLEKISEEDSNLTAQAERSFLQGVGGSCLTPLGGMASIEGNHLIMNACILDPKGNIRIDVLEKGKKSEADLIGAKCAGRLLAEGGSQLL